MTKIGSIMLGNRYRDSISGYEGVAISVTVYLYGCYRVGLERVDEKGKPEIEYFDEQRMVAIDTKQLNAVAIVGGPHDAPPQRTPPSRG